MSSFPNNLRRIREAKNLTPYRLAQLTGLSKQGVLNLEGDGADPKLSTVEKLAKSLGVPVNELLGSEGAADKPAGKSTAVDRSTRVDHGKVGETVAAVLPKLNEVIKELQKSQAAMSTGFAIHTVWEVRKALEPLAPGAKKSAKGKPSASRELFERVKPLIKELDDIGHMHEACMSPVAVRMIAAKLRKLFELVITDDAA